jgi:uncharacterized protein YecE (DUF72 family)
MGWSYSFWKPVFYPKNLPAKDFLTFYAKHFDTVEADSTFYRIPNIKTVNQWREQTPESFRFSLKFPQKITHIKMLRDCQEDTRVFLERADLLKEKLGVLLLQFPPMFRHEHLPLLSAYLKTLPEGHRYAVEVRNKSMLTSELTSLLRQHEVALAWVDATKMPLIEEKTARFVYVRWEGDRKVVTGRLGKPESDRSEGIREWSQKLKALVDEGIEVFGYFSKFYSGFPPADVTQLLGLMK